MLTSSLPVENNEISVKEEIIYEEKNSILDLIHRPPSSLIRSLQDAIELLSVLSKLISLAIDAAEDFKSKKIKKFDALVGDNLCQIRAYFLYRLISSGQNYFKSKDDLIYAKKLLDDYVLYLHGLKAANNREKIQLVKNVKLGHLLLQIGAQFYIPERELMLIMLYILSKYTISNCFGFHLGIHYKKLQDDLLCSKALVRNVIHEYQKKLSMCSSQFILSLSYVYKNRENPNLLKIDDNGRYVLPIFFVTKVLLGDMIKKSVPILFKININSVDCINNDIHFNLLFRPVGEVYKLCQYDKESKFVYFNETCVVFNGITYYKDVNFRETKKHIIERIKNIGVLNVILANTARHPQYPGRFLTDLKKVSSYDTLNVEKEETLSILQNELFEMKEKALRWGCCQDNPELFLITHIYCDIMSKYEIFKDVYTSGFGQTISERIYG